MRRKRSSLSSFRSLLVSDQADSDSSRTSLGMAPGASSCKEMASSNVYVLFSKSIRGTKAASCIGWPSINSIKQTRS